MGCFRGSCSWNRSGRACVWKGGVGTRHALPVGPDGIHRGGRPRHGTRPLHAGTALRAPASSLHLEHPWVPVKLCQVTPGPASAHLDGLTGVYFPAGTTSVDVVSQLLTYRPQTSPSDAVCPQTDASERRINNTVWNQASEPQVPSVPVPPSLDQLLNTLPLCHFPQLPAAPGVWGKGRGVGVAFCIPTAPPASPQVPTGTVSAPSACGHHQPRTMRVAGTEAGAHSTSCPDRNLGVHRRQHRGVCGPLGLPS